MDRVKERSRIFCSLRTVLPAAAVAAGRKLYTSPSPVFSFVSVIVTRLYLFDCMRTKRMLSFSSLPFLFLPLFFFCFFACFIFFLSFVVVYR